MDYWQRKRKKKKKKAHFGIQPDISFVFLLIAWSHFTLCWGPPTPASLFSPSFPSLSPAALLALQESWILPHTNSQERSTWAPMVLMLLWCRTSKNPPMGQRVFHLTNIISLTLWHRTTSLAWANCHSYTEIIKTATTSISWGSFPPFLLILIIWGIFLKASTKFHILTAVCWPIFPLQMSNAELFCFAEEQFAF